MVRRRDRLTRHWVHPILVQRRLGAGAHGDVWGQTEMIRGAVDGTTRMVRNTQGAEVVSSMTVALPLHLPDTGERVAPIPPGSLVTLPASHGGRTARVIDTRTVDGGGMPAPEHVALALE